jgi:cysteine dioxygenase
METELFSAPGLDAERLLGWRLPPHAPGDSCQWRDLARQFSQSRIAWSLLDRHIEFSERAYTRIVLFTDPEWSVLLLGWLPGQASPIHGHGPSIGLTRVLLGHLNETVYVRDQPNSLAVRRQHDASDTEILFEGQDIIHRVRNTSLEPSISLHLYAPPFTKMVDLSGLKVRAD